MMAIRSQNQSEPGSARGTEAPGVRRCLSIRVGMVQAGLRSWSTSGMKPSGMSGMIRG